jgi:hypothetical protein
MVERVGSQQDAANAAEPWLDAVMAAGLVINANASQ